MHPTFDEFKSDILKHFPESCGLYQWFFYHSKSPHGDKYMANSIKIPGKYHIGDMRITYDTHVANSFSGDARVTPITGTIEGYDASRYTFFSGTVKEIPRAIAQRLIDEARDFKTRMNELMEIAGVKDLEDEIEKDERESAKGGSADLEIDTYKVK